MMSQARFTSVARNSLWIYPRVVRSRFPNAPAIIETTRSYEAPEFAAIPEGGDVECEIYNRALSIRLDGEKNQVYIARFVYVRTDSYREALDALAELWRRIMDLDSVEEVQNEMSRWWFAWKGARSIAEPREAPHLLPK
jgi:hypothetical protein